MVLITTLLVIGMLLLISEIFLPGMVAGLAGFICLGLGVALSFRDLGTTQGGIVLLGVMALLVVGFAIWLRYFPESSFAKPFVSEGKIGGLGIDHSDLVGKEGITFTQLRPSGTVVIDGRHLDVVTEGEPVAKDQSVKVVQVEGMRIVVRKS
jgi:membrane-bound serine protease (ClpP class)